MRSADFRSQRLLAHAAQADECAAGEEEDEEGDTSGTQGKNRKNGVVHDRFSRVGKFHELLGVIALWLDRSFA
jgi:hypothetical protein